MSVQPFILRRRLRECHPRVFRDTAVPWKWKGGREFVEETSTAVKLNALAVRQEKFESLWEN